MLSRRRFLLLCGLLMSAPCTVGTAKTRNVLVPSAPGQVIVVGPGGNLVAGGVPVQWRGEWVSTVNYDISNIVTRNHGVYIANVAVALGGDPPDRYTLDGIVPSEWLDDDVFVERNVNSHGPHLFLDEQALLAPRTFTSAYVMAFFVSVAGDIDVTWTAPSSGTPAIPDWSGVIYNEGVELGAQWFDQNYNYFTGDAVGGSFSFTANSPGAYFLAVTNRINFLGAFRIKVTATTATIGSRPTINWDQMSHEPLQPQLYRGRSVAETFDTGFLFTSGLGSVNIDFDYRSKWVVYCDTTVTFLSINAASSSQDTKPYSLTFIQNGGGSGGLASNLWTAGLAFAGTVHGAASLPTNLGSSDDDALVIWFEGDYDQTGPFVPQLYPMAVFNETSTGSLPSWWTPATLTVSTDAVGTYPSNTLTIDWTVSREYSVSLDAPLGNLVFLPSTGAMSPTRPPLTLRLNQQGGSGALHPDVWILTGGSIMNWRDLPTSIGTSNGDPLVAVFDYDETAQLYTMIGVDVMDDALENGARIDYENPITGFSYPMYNGTTNLVLDPAGVLATGTVTFPSQPHAGEEVKIVSTKVITAFTLSPNAGQSVTGAPSTLAANVPIRFVWDRSNAMWWPE